MKKRNFSKHNLMNLTIYSLLIIIPFFYLRKMAEPALGARWIVLNIISVLLPFILITWNYFSWKDLIIKLNRIHFLLLAIMIWMGISGLWTVDKANYIETGINFFSIFLLIFFFSYNIKTLNLKIIFHLLFVAVSLISFLGLLQYFGLFTNLYGQTAPPAAGFVNKNLTTSTIALLFPITYLSLLFSQRNRVAIGIYFSGFTISLTYLIVASTRSAWLGSMFSFFILLVIIIILRKRFVSHISRSKIFVFLCAILMAISLIWFHDFLQIDSGRSRSLDDQVGSMLNLNSSANTASRGTITLRLTKWQNGLEMFKSKPIAGIGLGNFDALYPLYHKSAVEDRRYDDRIFMAELHNEPLQVLIELGIIGFLLIAVFFVVLFIILIRLIKSDSLENSIYFLAILSGISALVVDSFFNHSFHFPTVLFYFSLFVGITISKYTEKFEPSSLCIRIGKSAIFFLILFAMLSLISFHISHRKYQANILHRKALSYDKANRTDEAARFSNQAVQNWPFRNMFTFHAVRINGRNYLKNAKNKDFQNASALVEKALNDMQYNYLMNYIDFKIALKSRSRAHLKKVEKKIPLLMKIAPYSRIYDAYDVIRNYYEIVGDSEKELEYYILANHHAGDSYYEHKKYVLALKYYNRLATRTQLSEELQQRVIELENIINSKN